MFENIIGNETIKNILEENIKRNHITHSYLMVGIQGIGKKMIAKEYAKAILCLNENKPCNNCKSCIEFNTDNNPDFLCVEPEGNNIKIEQVRKLQKQIQAKPVVSTRKVYIIDDADLMTKEAQNCLLKTLEEPPEFASIILIGTNENSFLTTIKSRCMILHFNRLEDVEVKKYLEQNYDEKNITQGMLDIASGSIGRAINLKDKQEQYEKIEQLINSLDKKDLIDIVKSAEILYKSKDDINDMLDYANVILLRKAKTNYLYTNCIKIVENTKKRLNQNANYDMSIDNMLFKIWEEIN